LNTFKDAEGVADGVTAIHNELLKILYVVVDRR
jgi:hypothetical protein